MYLSYYEYLKLKHDFLNLFTNYSFNTLFVVDKRFQTTSLYLQCEISILNPPPVYLVL